MTAINAIKFSDALVVYTDTAFYNAAGVCEMFAQKAHVLFPQKAIVALRGIALPAGVYRGHASHRGSFDDIADHMVDDLKDAIRVAVPEGPVALTAFVGGWSERAGDYRMLEMWAFGSDANTFTDESFQPHPFDPMFVSPLINPEPLATLLDAEGRFGAGDPDVVRLMELQRATNYRLSGFGQALGCIVGGAIQKTVLTQTSATTEIIHTWPDQVGALVGLDTTDREDYRGPGVDPWAPSTQPQDTTP